MVVNQSQQYLGIMQFKQQLNPDNLMVADNTLYTAPNLEMLLAHLVPNSLWLVPK